MEHSRRGSHVDIVLIRTKAWQPLPASSPVVCNFRLGAGPGVPSLPDEAGRAGNSQGLGCMMERHPETDPYRAVGYGDDAAELGDRPAILVVDMQLAYSDPAFPFAGKPSTERAFENAAALTAQARALGIPIASCYTAYESDAEMPHWRVRPVRELFRVGHPCTRPDPRVTDDARDYVFRKTGASIFFKTPVVTFLTRLRIDTVIVVGVATSGCIRASVVDSFQYGYRTVVPEDCVGDVDVEAHRANLADIERRYATISSLRETLAYLEGVGSRPHHHAANQQGDLP
jgi:maleamate amidohydrolase